MAVTDTLTEMLFVAHFASPLNLTFLDVAAWYEEFHDFPVVQQTPAVPPLDLSQFGQQQLFAVVPDAGLPRVLLRSINHPFVIQLQADRFGFSWSRIGDLGSAIDYPGYASLKSDFFKKLARLNTWHRSRFGGSAAFRLVEISYYNSLPLEKSPGQMRRLSSVFKFVTPGRPVNSFGASWTELLHPGVDAPRVVAQTGVGAVAKPPSLTSTIVIFFNFSGIGSLSNVASDDTAISGMIDHLHDRIFEMYQAAIISQA